MNANPNTYRQLIAGYTSGHCFSCNRPIIKGDEILYRTADKRIHHQACPITPTYCEPTRAERFGFVTPDQPTREYAVTPSAPMMTQAQSLANLRPAVTATPVSTTVKSAGRIMADALRAEIYAAPQRPMFSAAGELLPKVEDSGAVTLPRDTPATLSIAKAESIRDGFYTVVREDNTHVTFRIKTQPSDAPFAPGQRVIGALVGSNNESDYKNFAFLSDGYTVNVWKSCVGKVGDWKDRAYSLVQTDWTKAGKVYAMESGNCFICNRTLTTPESITAGIGPVCARK